ncbi:MAG: FixH family protein [Gammaproteobacteria bacterium]|jgi:hypothetical protein|nr:FixH family protein [Gammaproteobacteria bacterium]
MKNTKNYAMGLALTLITGVIQADMMTTKTTCMAHAQDLTYMCKVNLSRHGHPVTDASISVSADMPSMPMAHNIKPVMALPVADMAGQYMYEMELEMAGTWRLIYHISSPFVDRLHEPLIVGADGAMAAHSHSHGTMDHSAMSSEDHN